MACSTTPPESNASRFSLTALTLPGRVTTSVFLIVPATGLDKAAKGVCFKDVDIMRCTRPGASRSIRAETAWNQVITVRSGSLVIIIDSTVEPQEFCPARQNQSLRL